MTRTKNEHARKNKGAMPETQEERDALVEAFLAKGGTVKECGPGDTALEDFYALSKAQAAWRVDVNKES